MMTKEAELAMSEGEGRRLFNVAKDGRRRRKKRQRKKEREGHKKVMNKGRRREAQI